MTERRATVEACRLTAPGRSAVATIAVRGPDCAGRVAPLVEAASGRPLELTEVGRVVFARWRSSGEELVVCRTADDRLEIHCHGGDVAAAHILDSLRDVGIVMADVDTWLEGGGESPAVLAARRLLGEAPTVRTAGILLDQLRGAWDREAHAIERLLDEGRSAEALRRIEQLTRRAPVGRHLVDPWRVVLCGAPNVGKSTLMNRLLGFERSVVWDRAGTTRDAVGHRTVIDGWPIELTDTAGLRQSDDPLEQEGARRAAEAIRTADLVLEVVDATAPASRVPMAEGLAAAPRILVVNKIDLVEEGGSSRPARWRSDGPVVQLSALTGLRLDELLATIQRRLVPEPPPAGAAVPIVAAQRNQLASYRRRVVS